MASEPSIPFTSQESYAQPDQWEALRPIITHLYERHTLPEVMKIMKDEHSFIATPKMFKARIKKWGLDKNLKAADILEIVQLRDRRLAEGKESEFTIRGKCVSTSEIDRYVKRCRQSLFNAQAKASQGEQHQRSAIVCRTPSPELVAAPSPAQAAVLFVEPDFPNEMRLYFLASSLTTNWMSGSIESGSWTRSIDSGFVGHDGERGFARLNGWMNDFSHAMSLLFPSGQRDRGFLALNAALNKIPRLLRQEDSPLLMCMMLAVKELEGVDVELSNSISRFFGEMSEIVLGLWHPITQFWRNWRNFKKLNGQELIRHLFRPFLKWRITEDRDQQTGMLFPYLASYYFSFQKSFGCDLSSLELETQQFLRTVHPSLLSGLEIMDIKLGLVGVLFRTGKLDEAAALLEEIDQQLSTCEHAKGAARVRWNWYWRKYYLFVLKQDYAGAISFCRYWLAYFRGLHHEDVKGAEALIAEDLRNIAKKAGCSLEDLGLDGELEELSSKFMEKLSLEHEISV